MDQSAQRLLVLLRALCQRILKAVSLSLSLSRCEYQAHSNRGAVRLHRGCRGRPEQTMGDHSPFTGMIPKRAKVSECVCMCACLALRVFILPTAANAFIARSWVPAAELSKNAAALCRLGGPPAVLPLQVCTHPSLSVYEVERECVCLCVCERERERVSERE